VVYWRFAAVACTLAFAALLVWLYGVRTTVIWAAAMTAFIVLLWAATIPLRRRQRRVWLDMGLGPDGRPLPEEEEEDDTAGGGRDPEHP
jgi:hypothetical protein